MTEPIDQPSVNSTTPDHEPNVDGAISRNGDVAKVISTRTGLLDLPPEVRLMILRHLLVNPNCLPDMSGFDNPFRPPPDLSILRTSKLIHQEAFDVLYRENRFDRSFWYPSSPITRFPRIVDTIQNIGTEIYLGEPVSGFTEPPPEVAMLMNLIQIFGNHSIIRRNFVLELFIEPSPQPLKFLVRALGRFTNFRTITLQIWSYWDLRNGFSEWCELLKSALEPVLGYAEEIEILDWMPSAIGLRFHPVDFQNRSREPHDGDPGGIRPGCNETLTDTDESGRPTQEWERKTLELLDL